MIVAAAIAANRFGLGARAGELAAARADARGWLAAQLRGLPATPEQIRALPSSAHVFESLDELRDARGEARRSPQAGGEPAKRFVRTAREKLAPVYLDQVAARYRVAMETEASFRERLVHFWSNHFAVSADKPPSALSKSASFRTAASPPLSTD